MVINSERIHAGDDHGFTLTELIVAMGLLTIFMSIFTTVTLMMSNGTNKVQAISQSVTQANQAFLALDKTIRYASAISTPGVTNAGTWHVEFDTTSYASGAASDVCTQLRISNNQLQKRTWTVSGSSYASGSLSGWTQLSNNVTNGSVAVGSANSPFVNPDAGTGSSPVSGAAVQYQRLTITVVAGDEAVTSPDTNTATMTFAAVNSVAGATTSVCQQVAADSTS